MNLNHTVTDTMDHGNLLALSSSYTTSDGQSHDMADVWFARDTGAAGAGAASGATDLTAHDLLAAPGESSLVTAATAATSATGSASDAAPATSTASSSTTTADSSGAADQVMVDTAAIAAVQGLADAMLEEQQRQVLI